MPIRLHSLTLSFQGLCNGIFFKITSGIPSYFGSHHITKNQLFVFLVHRALVISSNWVSNYQKIFLLNSISDLSLINHQAWDHPYTQ